MPGAAVPGAAVPGAAAASGAAPAPRTALTARHASPLLLLTLFALAAPPVYAALHRSIAPEPVTIQNPCDDRDLPHSGGITGFLQDRVLEAVDAGACRLKVSREELVLALADELSAKRFEQRHGVDPRSVTSLLGGLLNP